ncbi:Low-density lipoprotein receptor repeat class B [Vibrio aerogenes CECT 7868]|uniref:Low-density lipoprotein receptor repeat class B n=1 Tax=Vibrio aerogenes CECT 7868 TaxID=1216006 RepID=A0A1M5Z6T3_9VIBR|nr:DUF5050 domain-containing protein [Vibrio aerogenes]SHI19798.1 Low-density lipoprotein receptor repeat class B [Vibrio aerogenes CECT 7868]
MDNQDLKQRIKSNFQTGKIPTQSQFYELIDEALNPDAARLTEGTLDNARLPSQIDLTQGGKVTSTQVKAETLIGNGSQITDLNNDHLPSQIDLTQGGKVTGTQVKAETLIGNGSQITDLNNAHLPAEIDLTQGGAVTGTQVKADTLVGDTFTGTDATFSDQLEAKNLKGDGSGLTALNADEIATGTVDNKRLVKANKTQPGIARFATQAEATQGKDANLAVTPKQMQDAISSTKSNLEKEIGLLQAGVKFKQGVATVMTDSFNLAAGHDFPVIDSYQIKTGDRVLFTNQSDNKQNRVYVASEGNLWTLATDFDSNPDEELFIGLSVEVMEGSDLLHSIWTVTNLENPADPELTWQKRNDINNYQAGDGIRLNGLEISADSTWFKSLVSTMELNASNIVKGMVASDYLPFATDTDVSQGTTDKIVSPKQLSTQLTEIQTQADAKFATQDDVNSQITQHQGQLKRLDTAVWETPNIGVEYYSPDQHSGIFGDIIRLYIDPTLGTEDTIISMPGGELIDARLMVAENDVQSVLSSEQTRVKLLNTGELKLQLASGYTLRGGWVDYAQTKLTIYYFNRPWLAVLQPGESGASNLVEVGNKSIHGIEVDSVGNKIYWKQYDESSKEGFIKRANLDGSNPETVLEVGLTQGLAIDPIAKKIYWCDWGFWFTKEGKGILYSANLDGSGKTAIYSNEAHLGNTRHLSLDLKNRKIYWVDMGDRNHVYRANLDGTDFEDISTITGHSPGGIAVDSENNKIYWTSYYGDSGTVNDGSVLRANLDGSGVETLIDSPNANKPSHIELDLPANHLYYVDSNGGKLKRANLDGSEITEMPYYSGDYFSLLRFKV